MKLLNNIQVKGIIPALVTPFDQNYKINKDITKKLINYILSTNVNGLFVNSGAGEFSTLTFKEKKDFIQIIKDEVNGRVPVYTGTGAITTEDTIELTKMAEDLGSDGMVIIAPYSISLTQEELYLHYVEIAECTKKPIIVYNHPKRTGNNISVGLAKKLSNIGNIVGIKDSSGDFSLLVGYIGLQSEKFSVLVGNDKQIYAGLLYGARGSISSIAGVVPSLVVNIYESFLQHNYDKAFEAQKTLFPLRDSFSLGTFPVVLKEALKLKGIDVGPTRKPIRPLKEDNINRIKKILKMMGEV